ncbi:MAG: MFS transporter [Candidatus Thorarchaeota archaeon]|jgi:UMF1 family MFS transporter
MEVTEQIPTDRRERIAWYLFDFANTSFTVLIVTALFPLFFRNLVTDYAMDGGFMGTAFWGYAGTMIVIAVTSPVLGAIADFSGNKKKFLTAYTAMCIIFNSLLFFTTRGSPPVFGLPIWLWAWIIFILANIGFQGALPFYNAWLPEISDETNIGRIGGIGFAAGYVGALLTIIIALVSVLALGTDSTVPFLLGALFFLVFAIPSIRGLKNRPANARPDEEGMSLAKVGFTRVAKTIRELRTYQGVPLFMVAYFLFSDAITTVIYYAALFGETVYAFSQTDILLFFAVTQLTAIPGAFIFGYVADRIKTKPTLMITLLIWIVALLIAFFGDPANQLIWWGVGMIAGVGMGSAQSTARSMFGQYIPEEKKSEMYGFYALTGKFAAILGPALYAFVVTLAGNAGFDLVWANKYALLSVLVFFVAALLILVKVRQPVMGSTKTEVYLEDDFAP